MMSEYLILIYSDEKSYANADQGTIESILAAHRAFGQKYAAAIKGANALWGTDTATSISADGTVTDGPFAETKEALGGYYLVDAANLDEAIAIAREVPGSFGGVEVRPVRVYD
jgi:hypothetical protein